MLLIHDHQPQLGKLDFLLQQRMRPNYQLCVSLRDMPPHLPLAVRLQRSRQQHNAVPGILQNPPRREIMLLRQNLSRRHQGHLASVLNRNDGRLEAHDRLTRSHVPLQQTPHRIRLLHVGRNFLQHALLCGRGMKRQNLLNRRPHPVVQSKCDSGLRLLLVPLQLQPQFHEEQLVKDHPDMRRRARRLQRFEAFARLRPVHVPQRGPRRNQAEMRAHRGRNRVRQVRREIVERGANRLPEPARRQPSDRLVNGNDAPNLQRLGSFLFRAVLAGVSRVPQDLELRLNDLQLTAAFIFFNLAVERDHLPGRELVLQVGRIEKEATQARAPLSDGQLKNRHFPRAEQPGIAHFADDCGHLARA